MTSEDVLPVRKHPAHGPLIEIRYRSSVVLITVCVRGRRPLLARSAIQQVLEAAWREAESWCVGRYVLMPDHLHLFCAPRRPDAALLPKWVTYWKSRATKHWPYSDEKPVWQRDFWDRQLRGGESYALEWQYVIENPVRAGLCHRPEDWPFRGELETFRFHDA